MKLINYKIALIFKFCIIYLTMVLSSAFALHTEKKVIDMQRQKEDEIPLTEDLMREHGILNRVLLIYEEIIRRIEHNSFPIDAFGKAIDIIKTFIEDYHEKLEETYIFPLFERHKQNVSLTQTLRKQHKKGREITAKLQEIATTHNTLSPKVQETVIILLKKFVTMYRPHEAREDTVLFPKVRSLLSEREFNELGEKFEDLEHKLFGENGFQTIVKKVEHIEKELGIYKLEQFTPSLTKIVIK